MNTLYLRNVPDEVMDRLKRMASMRRTSVSALAIQELAESSRRADNPALLSSLPDHGIDPATLVTDLENERARR